jgi:hypothetical protein
MKKYIIPFVMGSLITFIGQIWLKDMFFPYGLIIYLIGYVVGMVVGLHSVEEKRSENK